MVQNNRVQLLYNLRVFNVSNENDQVCVVKLHPESSSCAEKKGCSHILAAKLSIGRETIKKNKKSHNLTQLRCKKLQKIWSQVSRES